MRLILGILALLGPSVASAANFLRAEEAAFAGDAQFNRTFSLGLSAIRGFTPRVPELGRARQMAVPGAGEFETYLRRHSTLPAAEAFAANGTPSARLSLPALLNRQWKTPATYTMGGQTVFIGGAFDRSQNAFVSVYADGWKEPRFFNIKGLLEKEGELKVGAASYSVTLSANVLKPMKSQIVFENKADEDEQTRISVKRLLDSLHAAGESVALSGQSYQVFYYSDVVDGPAGPSVDPKSRTFAFIRLVGEDMHVFLIPAETVPSNQIAVFKMHEDKRVGLQVAGDSLKVFENP